MNYSSEQVLNGIMKYADSEVMQKLPTTGKWVMGTAINLASDKIENLVQALTENTLISMLGLIDDDENIDVDALIKAIKTSADKYGNMTVEVPLVGKLTFSSADVDRLRTYIN